MRYGAEAASRRLRAGYWLHGSHYPVFQRVSSACLLQIDAINYKIDGTNYEIDGTNFLIDGINFLFNAIESIFRGTIMP